MNRDHLKANFLSLESYSDELAQLPKETAI